MKWRLVWDGARVWPSWLGSPRSTGHSPPLVSFYVFHHQTCKDLASHCVLPAEGKERDWRTQRRQVSVLIWNQLPTTSTWSLNFARSSVLLLSLDSSKSSVCHLKFRGVFGSTSSVIHFLLLPWALCTIQLSSSSCFLCSLEFGTCFPVWWDHWET